MAETLTAKLLRAHTPGDARVRDDEVRLRVDQVLLEDYTGTMACLQFEQVGVDRIRHRAGHGGVALGADQNSTRTRKPLQVDVACWPSERVGLTSRCVWQASRSASRHPGWSASMC